VGRAGGASLPPHRGGRQGHVGGGAVRRAWQPTGGGAAPGPVQAPQAQRSAHVAGNRAPAARDWRAQIGRVQMGGLRSDAGGANLAVVGIQNLGWLVSAPTRWGQPN